MRFGCTLLVLVSTVTLAGAEPLTDGRYLRAAIWNDGQAEIAFYQAAADRGKKRIGGLPRALARSC